MPMVLARFEQREQPLKQLRRAWWAATDMQVDGYNGGDPAFDRIAAEKNAAVYRAVPDCDDPFGIRRSIICALERLAHVPGDRPCHEQHIGVAWRRHEMQPETFEIIEGVIERVDLEFAPVARAGINLSNRETAAQTSARSTLNAGAQFGQHLFIVGWRSFGQGAAHQCLEQNFAHS